MNKLNVIISNNSMQLLDNMILEIKNYINDFSSENIIIVPDRLSLLTEQRLFELLNIEVYLNLEVMGISKFANKIIKENNLSFFECSALESKLLVLKAIQNVKQDFKCFSKNYTLGFVDEIYAKIEQLKSSNVFIDDLVDDSASVGTRLKFEDLKLIYNEYEKLRGQKLDSGATLELFNKVCAESSFIGKCNVFFVGFDSMTRQGIQVLKNVTKNANLAYVCVVAPNKQINKNIYDLSFYNSVVNMCKEEKFESEMKWIDLPINNIDANTILNNIFTRKKTYALNNNFINVYNANSATEEIEFVCKSINYNLKTKNLTYKDFAICAPIEYHEEIKSMLNLIGVDAYCDSKISLQQTEPIKFLLSYLKYCFDYFDNNSLFKLISNDFCELSKSNKETLLNLINQYASIDYIVKYEVDLPEEILVFLNNLNGEKINKIDYVENYLENIKKILKKLNLIDKINNKIEFFNKKGEIYLEKIYLQIEEKLNLLIETSQNAISGEQIDFKDFYDIFEKAIIETEISAVPSAINQVFIGDTKSFYKNVKFLYVVGANEGSFPQVLNDCGLITDKEICSESIKAVIEPTTKTINKRNKFKALEVILSASEKTYLCYHKFDKDGKNLQPSEFVTEIKHLFNLNEISIHSIKMVDDNNINKEKLLFNNPNFYFANFNVRNGSQINEESAIKSALIKLDKLFYRPLLKHIDINFGELFFNQQKVSVSLIEKYSACPKAAFLANGLKIQKNKKDRIEAHIIGAFIHEVSEIFVKKNKLCLGKMDAEKVDTIVNEICEEIIKNKKYYSICLEGNIFIYKQIIKECKRFCNFINYEQSVSEFKPKYTEKYFGINSDFKPIEITVGENNYKISGIVDRIDVYDDYFRIIDYKTGETSNSKGKDNLFYGTKIQLFVYAEAIRKNINKKLFGAFYLPIKNSFVDGENNYCFSGFHLDSTPLAVACDSYLIENNKSEILNCSLKSKNDSELCLKKKNNILQEDELAAYIKYAIEFIKTAIKNMESGYIDCSPFKGKCNLCEFAKICKYYGYEKIERNESDEISNKVFLELNYD